MWILVVDDLVSLGCWDRPHQARYGARPHSAMEFDIGTRSPIHVVRGGTSSSAVVTIEGQSQLFQGQGRALQAQHSGQTSTHMFPTAPCGDIDHGDQQKFQLQQGQGS